MARRPRPTELAFPRRLEPMPGLEGRVFRCPALVFGAASVPLGFTLFLGSIFAAVSSIYGYGSDDLGGLLRTLGLPSLPGALLWMLYLIGRLEVVDKLPDASRHAMEPGPARLALPGAESDQPLRPVSAAPPPAPTRRPAEGLLFLGGCGAVATAIVLMVVQTENFDAVLGIKLGGVHWRGTYWNRWWFVFYAFLFGGLGSLASGLLLFVRRLNRAQD